MYEAVGYPNGCENHEMITNTAPKIDEKSCLGRGCAFGTPPSRPRACAEGFQGVILAPFGVQPRDKGPKSASLGPKHIKNKKKLTQERLPENV